MTVQFTLEDLDADVLAMIERVKIALDPVRMQEPFTTRLRKAFQEQVREAFARQGVPGGPEWAPLSEWREDDRIRESGDEGPILKHTGRLFLEAVAFRGKAQPTQGGFSYWYPDYYEMSGAYIGLTGGQQVNPLGATPLSATPRPILGGIDLSTQVATHELAAYLASQGFVIEVGAANDSAA